MLCETIPLVVGTDFERRKELLAGVALSMVLEGMYERRACNINVKQELYKFTTVFIILHVTITYCGKTD